MPTPSTISHQAKQLADTIRDEPKPSTDDLELYCIEHEIDYNKPEENSVYYAVPKLPIGHIAWVEQLGEKNPLPKDRFFNARTDPTKVGEYALRLTTQDPTEYEPVQVFYTPAEMLDLVEGNHRKEAKLSQGELVIPAIAKTAGYWEAQQQFAIENTTPATQIKRVWDRVVWHYGLDPPPSPEEAYTNPEDPPQLIDILELASQLPGRNRSGEHLFNDPEIAAANKLWATLQAQIWIASLKKKPSTIKDYFTVVGAITPEVYEQFDPTNIRGPVSLEYLLRLAVHFGGEANSEQQLVITEQVCEGNIAALDRAIEQKKNQGAASVATINKKSRQKTSHHARRNGAEQNTPRSVKIAAIALRRQIEQLNPTDPIGNELDQCNQELMRLGATIIQFTNQQNLEPPASPESVPAVEEDPFRERAVVRTGINYLLGLRHKTPFSSQGTFFASDSDRENLIEALRRRSEEIIGNDKFTETRVAQLAIDFDMIEIHLRDALGLQSNEQEGTNP